MLLQNYNFNLFADYFQFYLQDELAESALSSKIWSEQAVEDLLAVESGIINVGTVRNMIVPVLIEFHDTEPKENFSLWDHITECSIAIPSGKLVIAGCTDYFPDAKRIKITPGVYQVRIFYGALNTLSKDGLSGNDHYKVALWQGKEIKPQILKRRVKEKLSNAR